MKYFYAFIIALLLLIFSHVVAYKRGYGAGENHIYSELYEDIQNKERELAKANQKILDFQRVISNNNDECFNRVWPDEIINVANPQLR